MILRLHTFLAGCLTLLLAALLALAPVGAKPASGGYQLFGGAASGHQADISLAALENFDYFAKIAPECCNAVIEVAAERGRVITGSTINAISSRITTQGGTSSNSAKFADQSRLEAHYRNHGSDFGAKSASDYETMANNFLTSPKPNGVLEKTRANGDILRFDPATGDFGVVTNGGIIRTYYKPAPASPTNPRGYDPSKYSSPLDYFNAQ